VFEFYGSYLKSLNTASHTYHVYLIPCNPTRTSYE